MVYGEQKISEVENEETDLLFNFNRIFANRVVKLFSDSFTTYPDLS